MAHERDRKPMLIPDGDEFELWKEGELLRWYPKFDDAKADCDRGNRQTGNFEVRRKGERLWPPSSARRP